MNLRIKPLFFVLLLFSCVHKNPIIEEPRKVYRWPVMGTFFEIQWQSAFKDQDAISNQIFEIIREVDDKVSIYKQYSDLSLLNQHAGDGKWIPIHPITHQLIRLSFLYERETKGNFNIGVGSLMKLWGLFLPVHGMEKTIPSDEKIKETMPLLNLTHLEIEEGRARLNKAGMVLDMGGIAKGYALDLGIQLAKKYDVPCGYMNLGRQMMVVGSCAAPLEFAIQNPEHTEKIAATVSLSEGSISTSGNYEKYFVHKGRSYSHILDPTSGEPVQNDLHSVSVWMQDAASADVLSTALFVMGYEKGKQFAQKYHDSIGIYWIFKSRKPESQNSKYGKIKLTEK